MFANWKNRMTMVAGAVLLAIVLIVVARSQQAQAQREGVAGPAPRYTVIETQGFNLLVADNAANKLYFYATDKDVPVGSPLKLRASLDLSKVGQEELSIKTHNLENMRKKEEKKE
jgi:hypothetical protein